MSDITVTVSSPADSINVSVPAASSPSISVADGSDINVDVSTDASVQRLVDLSDVTGTPAASQIIIYDDAQSKFVFQDLALDDINDVVSDIQVTNTDEGFAHLNGFTYSGGSNISLETVLRNILNPTAAATFTMGAAVQPEGYYEVRDSSNSLTVVTITFAANPFASFSGGIEIFVDGVASSFDDIVPTSGANTQHGLYVSGTPTPLSIQSETYRDFTLQLKATDGGSINSRSVESSTLTWKIRPKHIFYGSTTAVSQGAADSSYQTLYNAIVTASASALGQEQLKDNASSYVYDNDSDKYNINATDAFAYYFYPSSLGQLTEIKLGGEGGLDIMDAFVDLTNGTPVSITNSLGASTSYYVYRSVNRKAFTSNQSIYFAN